MSDIKFAPLSLDSLADGEEIITEWITAPDTTPTERAPVPRDISKAPRKIINGMASLAEVKERMPQLAGTVAKEPLYTADGVMVPEAFASIRTLPSGAREALGVVGKRYVVVQDAHAFSILEPLIEQGIIGNLNAGSCRAKTWLYGESGTHRAEIVRGDEINARVLVANSHDGSIPWVMGFPGNVVICENTLHMALSSELSKLLKVRHTAKAEDLIAQVVNAVKLFGMDFVTNVDKYKYLATIKVNETTLQEYTAKVFSTAVPGESTEETAVAGKRVYAKILENFQAGKGANLRAGTAWGAYNAVTEFLTHQRGRGSDAAKFADLQWGQGALLSRRALDLAVSL